MLAGSVGQGSGRRASDGMRAAVEWLRDTVDAWEKLCAELGAARAEAVLEWDV